MARVTVTPQEFHFVRFDAARIAELVDGVAQAVGVPADTAVLIEIDERMPTGNVQLAAMEPITIQVQGAAFENAKKPRDLSEKDVQDTVGRWLVRALDRSSAAFADAPAEADVPIAQNLAWTVACAGRCEQAGFRPSQERWRYHFRNRHAFSDVSDACFDRLWAATSPTWAEIVATSAEAAASRQAVG